MSANIQYLQGAAISDPAAATLAKVATSPRCFCKANCDAVPSTMHKHGQDVQQHQTQVQPRPPTRAPMMSSPSGAQMTMASTPVFRMSLAQP